MFVGQFMTQCTVGLQCTFQKFHICSQEQFMIWYGSTLQITDSKCMGSYCAGNKDSCMYNLKLNFIHYAPRLMVQLMLWQLVYRCNTFTSLCNYCMTTWFMMTQDCPTSSCEQAFHLEKILHYYVNTKNIIILTYNIIMSRSSCAVGYSDLLLGILQPVGILHHPYVLRELYVTALFYTTYILVLRILSCMGVL